MAAIAERAAARGIALHCDAVQAAGKIEIDVSALNVSYLVVSAHKLGGPKGTGALVVRRGVPFESLFRGSAHEKGRRGGTENAPAIVGFGVAAQSARDSLATERVRLLALRREFESQLLAAIPDMVVHAARAPRLPNTVNASFPGARSDTLLMALDARGVAVSAGAACSSGAVEPSPVLAAMKVPVPLATTALRMSMGWSTTEDEVPRVAGAVAEAVHAIRKSAAGVTT
jgi:cysteine desulfurase